MKYTIEIETPEPIDLYHAYTSITDALEFSDNVTLSEYDLVSKFITQLIKQNQPIRP